MVDEIKRKHILNHGLVIALSLCIAGYLVIFAIINVYGFVFFCDSDMYPDTLIAKYMWEQKTLFPEGWTFGNQLYVVATPALAALFYGLTGSINWGMILATETMSVLIVLSFFWVMRAITDDWLLSCSSCVVLIASVIAPQGVYSYSAQLFFLQASYYACYLITLFVVYGDYIRAFKRTDLRPVALSLAVVLCFATGMQSLRQTVIMVLPIVACEIFLVLRRAFAKEVIWDSQFKNSLIRTGCYTVSNLFGILFVKVLKVPQSTIIGNLEPISASESIERIRLVGDAFLQVSGLEFLRNPDYHWFFGVFALVQVVICIVAAIVWFAHILRKKTPLELCWLLSLVGIFGVALSSVLFRLELRGIYLFLYYPLVAFSWLMLLEKLQPPAKQIAIIVICIFAFSNLNFSYRNSAETSLQNSPSIAGRAFRLARRYGYSSKAGESDQLEDAKDMCNWALENGYAYLYGNWEDTPHIAVYSDGLIETGYWYPTENIYKALPYINPQHIYDAEENEKALYIFTDRDEERGIEVAVERGVTLKKVAEFGCYKAYTSPEPLMEIELTP